jgi:agmatinase
VPFEKSVSYGVGTREGPNALIDASRYVELYDEELDSEPASVGIHTLDPLDSECDCDTMMERLYRETKVLLGHDKFLCTVGGEHSISPPIVRAFQEKYPDLSVLQIDAHADLRDQYEGNRNSHACAMRRIVEICPAVQAGIRSLSSEEALAMPSLPTRVHYAKDIIGRTDWWDTAIAGLTDHVYLTFDVDGMDPSVISSTGTPEPGGFTWYEVLGFLRRAAECRRIVGMDMVELSGGPGSAVSSFIAAKLIYKILGYIFRQEIPRLNYGGAASRIAT